MHVCGFISIFAARSPQLAKWRMHCNSSSQILQKNVQIKLKYNRNNKSIHVCHENGCFRQFYMFFPLVFIATSFCSQLLCLCHATALHSHGKVCEKMQAFRCDLSALICKEYVAAAHGRGRGYNACIIYLCELQIANRHNMSGNAALT